MELNYASIIEKMADKLSDHPCLFYGDRTISWKEYENRAARIATALANERLGKESTVGLLLYNCCEYMEATLAAYKISAVPININYRYVADELTYLLNDCDAEALIFHSSFALQVKEIKEHLPRLKFFISVDDDGSQPAEWAVDYDDIVANEVPAERVDRSPTDTLMLYTGGTTGMPKGVKYHIGDTLSQMLEIAPMYFKIPPVKSIDDMVGHALARAEADQILVSIPASPLMHTAAIMNSGMLVHMNGGAMAILQSRSFEPRELWQTIQRRRANHLLVVGDTFVKPMIRVIEEDQAHGIQYDVGSLKSIVSTGVMFSKESKQQLLELGDIVIFDAVGATEGLMAIQISSRANPPAETAEFTALPTTEIFDETYQMLPRGCGEAGLIGIGGAGLPQGYHKDEEKSAKTFRTINGHRWGFTGDMATIDVDGTLRYAGRGSGCINTGGEKVFPEEVEEVVRRHPSVIDCLVVGLPDEKFGQRVAAVVSLRHDVQDSSSTLMEFCSTYLARFKLPRTIKVAETVQRAPNGKADYKWARAFLTE